MNNLFFSTCALFFTVSMEKYYYLVEEREGWRWPITGARIEVPRVNPMLEEMYHFCNIIKEKEKMVITGEDAKESLKVILAIKESARLAKAIKID